MNRRHFLLAAASSLALPALSRPAFATARKLTVASRTLDINGKAATVYGLTDDAGRPGLTLAPGERFAVDLANRLDEPTIVHWHGLTPPWPQDGVPDNPLPALAPSETRSYDFAVSHPGTFWMHAHTLQEQNLLAAPLIVHSAEDLTADRQEVVVLLHDFSFTPATELLARLTKGSGQSMHGMAHGPMQMGGMKMDGMGGMDMGSQSMGSMKMGSMDHGAMQQAMPGGMDLNDISYDAYLANDRTLDDPEVITVEKGGRVLVRLINGATATQFTIDCGSLAASLVAVDGYPVEPLSGARFPVTMGQRLDLLLEIPATGGAFPILALREGGVERTGVILATAGAPVGRLAVAGEDAGPVLDLSVESRLIARTQPPQAPIAARHDVTLAGDMMSYTWAMQGAEAIVLTQGHRVAVTMANRSMMAHPMHLHGHRFQVIAIDGKPISGAVRDTVLVPPGRSVTIAFDADNPGTWPFHCHHLYHMASGMMVHLPYAS
ncbi:multicopper oxidase family protein [Oryzibacter oryziterrae]|uniref:multicopper oxidase family protein n=1 Tax=Oryzibacter oryziterrae TaxID=2766474 RepID=UPI001F249280|nr:multicopper oxidase family protein [Oryzibacter oryziterrae]